MNPMIVVVLVGVGVAAAAGLLFFVFMDRGSPRAAERLDTLVGKRRKESAADLLIKASHQDNDKKNLLDAITPEIFSMTKIFEQAECNIKPSTLFGIALV